MGMPQPSGQSDPPHDPDHVKLTERDFTRVASRINALAGIQLEAHKAQMIQSRLTRRVRARHLSSITEYLDLLDGPDGGDEIQSFIDTLTTNLTSFFREKHHFDHLRQTVLGGPGAGDRGLRIWSAGCSTGEEPYSIAMTAAAALGPKAQALKVLATDLDSSVVARAKAGTYEKAKYEDTVGPEFSKYFKPATETGKVLIAPEIRNMITFRQLNLMEAWPMKGPFDAIFCRNVVIYFSAETKARLLDRYATLLAPGGILYLGHSEAILGEHKFFKSLGNTIYQRKDASE